MSKDNPWQLYSSVAGWETANIFLNNQLVIHLSKLDRLVKSGIPVSLATYTTFNEMSKVMTHHHLENYGATDSEPRSYLAQRIQKHIRETHHVKYYVDRFGDVTEH